MRGMCARSLGGVHQLFAGCRDQARLVQRAFHFVLFVFAAVAPPPRFGG